MTSVTGRPTAAEVSRIYQRVGGCSQLKSAFIRWTGWTLTMAIASEHCHYHCYYYYYYFYIFL